MDNLSNQSATTPELSVVVPAFNEAEGLAAFLKQLFDVLHSCCTDFEVWVIDDGSRDATWQQVRCEQTKYPQLRGVQFTRNFGKEAAILAGLRHARGRAVIVMDADGQHPPDLLPEMLKPWRSGQAQIVAAHKASRDTDGWRARLNARIFNGLMLALTGLGSLIATFTASPWIGALRALFYTLLLAAFAAFCTKRKFILRT